MKNKTLKLIKKRFSQKDRHIRYSYEKAPDSEDMINGAEKIRYHFIIQDDRFREEKIEKILSNFQEKTIINYLFEEIDHLEGKAIGTPYRYLYKCYESFYSPTLLNFKGISTNIKKDRDLRERKIGDIKEYIRKIYEGK